MSDSSALGELPDIDHEQIVSANRSGLVISIRHAQDVEDFELGFAQGTVTVTFHPEAVPDRLGLHRVYIGVLSTPLGVLSVGDADMDAKLPVENGETTVTVSVAEQDDLSPEHVWVDLWPTA